MRRLSLLGLLALLLIGGGYGARWKSDYRSRIVNGIHYIAEVGGLVTLFDAPLNTNGMEAADPATSWPVPGVAAPDVAWWGDDPTGSGGKTTHAFTAHGTPASIDTPFCPDGSWSDITSGCMAAMRFDGTNDYYTSDSNGVGAPSNSDFTVCALFRGHSNASDSTMAGNREGNAAGEGWAMQARDAASAVNLRVEAEIDDGTSQNADQNVDGAIEYQWQLGCGAFDISVGITPYLHATADTQRALVGAISPVGEPMSVGSDDANANPFDGDIAAVFVWTSTLLDATDMTELYEYFTGILDTKGAPVAYTNTGPQCCWVDGQIECYGDDWPMIGCELPPGVTGAGSPASGFYSGELLTNALPYSRDLDSWTDVNTPTPTATSTDLFRDGRSTYKITDNDGTKTEWIYSIVDIAALDAADKVQACVYAKGSDGAQQYTMRFQEATGAGCASTNDDKNQAITATWSMYEHTHTVADGDCEDINLLITPADTASASTGDAEMVVQVFLDQDWCPPLYIETAAAAVQAGGDADQYNCAGIVAGGTIKTPFTVSFDYTPGRAFGATSQQLWVIKGAGNNYLGSYVATNGRIYVNGNDAGGAENLYLSAAPAVAWTPGTTYSIVQVVGIDSTEIVVTIDDVDEPSLSPGSSISAPDFSVSCNAYIGAHYNSDQQSDGMIENLKVVRQ